MAKKNKSTPVSHVAYPKLKREYRKSFTMNEEEMKLMKRFADKYKVKNLSKYIRETVVRSMLNQLDEARPTLFD